MAAKRFVVNGGRRYAPGSVAARRFTRDGLAAYAGHTVADLLAPETRLLFVGINPGLWTAAVNAHFARPGNRFWPALYAAGITDRLLDVSGGMSREDAAYVTGLGIGITNLVPVATARADQLTREELVAGAAHLRGLVERQVPRVVAVLGKTAYTQAFGVRSVPAGRQDGRLAGAELWVLPNPSGLNAHDTVASLAAAYASAARAAGVLQEP